VLYKLIQPLEACDRNQTRRRILSPGSTLNTNFLQKLSTTTRHQGFQCLLIRTMATSTATWKIATQLQCIPKIPYDSTGVKVLNQLNQSVVFFKHSRKLPIRIVFHFLNLSQYNQMLNNSYFNFQGLQLTTWGLGTLIAMNCVIYHKSKHIQTHLNIT
jgi:hypothetical protein